LKTEPTLELRRQNKERRIGAVGRCKAAYEDMESSTKDQDKTKANKEGLAEA
jgi:hypothetical protein